MHSRSWMRSLALFGLAGLALPACSWVPLDPEADAVGVLSESAAAVCERIGEARTRTRAQVGPFGRSPVKLREEHEALARNEAARMGGDAVALVDAPNDGEHVFGVYRCRSD